MKLLGVRMDALAGVRRRPGTSAPVLAAPGEAAAPPDSAAFLGLGAGDLTGPVQAALTTLLGEIGELRQEVGRLKARLSEAEGLADEDVLTPLLNRRAFVRELRRVLAFTQRYGGPASLAYFDLDGFKAVNDRFGHAAGDVALQAVARRLADHVRESDIAGRLGGDEFGVILVHADHEAAMAKAAALAGIVEAEPVACGEWLMPVRISYGLGQIMPDSTAEQVLAEADAAMYARKRHAVAASGG
ncbi:MAG TPA: GGDEF domain-containing protein [Caulobacteraceae bacterium]|nr:GGDEF domain-containing protein [Caulobacteraceae bacterium]